jgi:hypothetical protein
MKPKKKEPKTQIPQIQVGKWLLLHIQDEK